MVYNIYCYVLVKKDYIIFGVYMMSDKKHIPCSVFYHICSFLPSTAIVNKAHYKHWKDIRRKASSKIQKWYKKMQRRIEMETFSDLKTAHRGDILRLINYLPKHQVIQIPELIFFVASQKFKTALDEYTIALYTKMKTPLFTRKKCDIMRFLRICTVQKKILLWVVVHFFEKFYTN